MIQSIKFAIARHPIKRKLNLQSEILAASENRLQTIINTNADGLIVVDLHGDIRFANPSAELIFGRTFKELIGSNFGFPTIDSETSKIEILQKSGKVLYAEAHTASIIWENTAAHLISIRNVTDRWIAEKRKKMLNNLLEHINNPINTDILIPIVLNLIKKYTGFEAIGIPPNMKRFAIWSTMQNGNIVS